MQFLRPQLVHDEVHVIIITYHKREGQVHTIKPENG